MRFALMTEPQEGSTYEALLEMAQEAEEAGFEAFFRSDHWLSLEGVEERSASDAWTTIAGLARETRSIRLGTLVSPITFRLPIAIAKIVATVDQMSGGRVELGLGAGWSEAEHGRFGIPFPPIAERFDRLAEVIQIVRGLWTERRFSFAGHYFQVLDAACEPKPLQQPHPPIIVGGYGRPRTLALAARYASELNLDSPEPEACSAVFSRLDEACRIVGRHPGDVARSAMVPWPAGPPDAQIARISAYAAVGVERLYLNAGTGPAERGTIRAFAREVLPAFHADDARQSRSYRPAHASPADADLIKKASQET
jgi:F420-dependent oxidoreductase-like protein